MELENLALTYGYVGVFILALVSNLTFFLPAPLVVPVYALGVTHNPILLGLSSGLGSTVGEFSSYFIGLAGKKIINERYEKQLEIARKLLQKYGVAMIFIFALTPLPDDLLLVTFGIIKYDLKKAFTAMLFGKIILNMIVAYAGRYSFSFVLDIMTSINIVQIVFLAFFCIITVLAFSKIDWSTVFKKIGTSYLGNMEKFRVCIRLGGRDI